MQYNRDRIIVGAFALITIVTISFTYVFTSIERKRINEEIMKVNEKLLLLQSLFLFQDTKIGKT